LGQTSWLEQCQIVSELDALKGLQAETAVNNTGQAATEFAALLPTVLDRAWTPSLPTRSGFALSLRNIRLARSQRARLKGEL